MRFLKTSLGAAAAGITAALLLASPANAAVTQAGTPAPQSATAAGIDLNQSQQAELRAFLTSYNVPCATQDNLLTKLAKGEAWLSILPGSTPVSTETRTVNRNDVTIERFSDGSIKVSSVTDPYAKGTPATSPWESSKKVSDCIPKSVLGGRIFQACEAKVDYGVIMMSFNFTYQNVGGTQKITEYWNPGYRAIGAAVSNQKMVRITATDVRTTAQADIAFKNFPAGGTIYMGVKIFGSTATTYNN